MSIRATTVLRILGVFYLVTGVVLAVYCSEWLYLVNLPPRVFHFMEAMPEDTGAGLQLWNIFAASQFAVLTALSFLAAESPAVRGYNLAHMLAKLISSVGFFYFFFNSHRYFIYVLGGAVDSVIFLLVLGCFLASFKKKALHDREPQPKP
jgi:hypothetical protein